MFARRSSAEITKQTGELAQYIKRCKSQDDDVLGKSDLLVADADVKAGGFLAEGGFDGTDRPSGKRDVAVIADSQTSHQNSSSGAGIGPESIQ